MSPWVALLLSALILLVVGCLFLLGRPPRRDAESWPYEGIHYRRRALSRPRRLLIHTVTVDLSCPGIGFLVTPGDEERHGEAAARSTSDFLDHFGVQVAINGSFFEPFREKTPWHYYPRQGDYVTIKGVTISNSRRYAEEELAYPALCLSPGRAEIMSYGCEARADQALAGNYLLVQDSRVLAERAERARHPRTAVGVSADGRTLWLVVVDGRQPGYSGGMSLLELAHYLLELGAAAALNLDGGGSSTLVLADPVSGRPRVLNSPIHTRIPRRQRPVANHLGVFARPSQPSRPRR
jgi:hypothetical protein